MNVPEQHNLRSVTAGDQQCVYAGQCCDPPPAQHGGSNLTLLSRPPETPTDKQMAVKRRITVSKDINTTKQNNGCRYYSISTCIFSYPCRIITEVLLYTLSPDIMHSNCRQIYLNWKHYKAKFILYAFIKVCFSILSYCILEKKII